MRNKRETETYANSTRSFVCLPVRPSDCTSGPPDRSSVRQSVRPSAPSVRPPPARPSVRSPAPSAPPAPSALSARSVCASARTSVRSVIRPFVRPVGRPVVRPVVRPSNGQIDNKGKQQMQIRSGTLSTPTLPLSHPRSPCPPVPSVRLPRTSVRPVIRSVVRPVVRPPVRP